ncbi:MAG: hypothetical protein ACWA5Q_05585 [bacterium]
MDETDRYRAWDFWVKTNIPVNVSNDSFYKDLEQDQNFKSALARIGSVTQETKIKLAIAVAQGINAYFADTTEPLQAKEIKEIGKAAKILLGKLRKHNVFDCGAEWSLQIDMLERLANLEKPKTGQQSRGGSLPTRKMVTALIQHTADLNLGAAVITDLAAVINPDIEKPAVESQIRRTKLKGLDDYCTEFTLSVYNPYLNFRDEFD